VIGRLREPLGGPEPGPDFVPSVMGRLGFMHASPNVVRRRKLARRWRRAAWMTMAVCTIGAGTLVLHHGAGSRRPSGPTISEALGNDVQRQRDGIGSVIKTIRRLAPPRPPSSAGESGLDPEVDRSAVAHVKWV
jgi:hypothetical protein